MTPETRTKYGLQRLSLDHDGYERGEPEFFCSTYIKDMWQTDFNEAVLYTSADSWKDSHFIEPGYSYRIITVIETTCKTRSLLS